MQPLISIVIPTYSRPDQLRNCLTAFTRVDYPRDRWELIIVDDGSIAPLDAIVEPFHNQIDLTLVRQLHLGPAVARNKGAAQARGQYVAFTDDDCAPLPNWLLSLSKAMADHPGSAIGGSTVSTSADDPYSTASQLLTDYIYEFNERNEVPERFFASNNLAFPTTEFLAMGGFNNEFPIAAAEDRELCHRWLAGGKALVYASEAIVEHSPTGGMHEYCRRHFNYGRGAYYFHRLKSNGTGWPLNRTSLQFYWNLLKYPLNQRCGHNYVTLTTLLILSQLANALGFFSEAVRGNRTAE